MSKARLVITALFVDHQSPAEVAARYGVHRAWVYKLKARYEAEGEAALEPRSRRPKTTPTETPQATVELVLRLRKQLTEAGLDAGADTIGWHLSPSPPLRPVTRHDQPDPGPRRRRDPRPVQAAEIVLHPVRGRAAQRDLAVRLHPLPAHPPRRPPVADTEIITWLDDHSRYALHVSAYARVTASIVLATFRQTGDLHGYPTSTSPTTAWSTPSDSPATAAKAAAPPSKPNCGDSGSPRRTPDRATPPPAARPSASSRR